MKLSAERVKELQHFLLDAAREHARRDDMRSDAAEGLLASAAGLDYVLLLASERPAELLDSNAAVAAGTRRTLTTAALAALHFVRTTLALPEQAFAEYTDRQVCGPSIFETLRALVASGGLPSAEIDFAIVTTASDLHERRRR